MPSWTPCGGGRKATGRYFSEHYHTFPHSEVGRGKCHQQAALNRAGRFKSSTRFSPGALPPVLVAVGAVISRSVASCCLRLFSGCYRERRIPQPHSEVRCYPLVIIPELCPPRASWICPRPLNVYIQLMVKMR